MSELRRLLYARQHPVGHRDSVQRVYVVLVQVDWALWAASLTAWSILVKRSPTGSLRQYAGNALEWSWAGFGILFAAGVLIAVAQRRHDRSWTFYLAMTLCALMGFAGLCADVMSR